MAAEVPIVDLAAPRDELVEAVRAAFSATSNAQCPGMLRLKMSALHAKQLPPVGGDTLFASTVAAFSALSSGMQQLLRKLEAVHSYSGPDAPDHPSETAVHPVVPVLHRHHAVPRPAH